MEALLSWVAFGTAGIQLLLAFLFIIFWAFSGSTVINIKEFVIYETTGYEFFIDLYFDYITAVYLFVGSFLTFLITIYSRYYLHRESGYKRFFNTILFFFFGYNIIIFAGNFETLFIGWEVLGISSFLLIAYYRERYLPVRNAFKVFSIYRLGDICIILAMWMSHHLWNHNITFLELNNTALVSAELEDHFSMAFFISLMILIAACVKSAQLPFSSWLPRAMEGPTPSSAIFYGSLSVHIGVFVLLRTFPFWEQQYEFRWIMAGIGFLTSVVSTFTGRVQSSVKSQIAYSSISQIGLIFIELALGLKILALIHFAGNAFLRSYQLLVSPSVVTYLIREQFYKFMPRPRPKGRIVFDVLTNSIYVLCVKEWNLETYMFRYLWNPFKKLGRAMKFINKKTLIFAFIPIYFIAVFLLLNAQLFPPDTIHYIPVLIALIGLLLVIRSFVERRNVQFSWLLIAFNHFWIALAVSLNEHFSISHIIIYLSGVVLSAAIGSIVLLKLQKKEKNLDLNRFYGHVYEYRNSAFFFLIACLGLAGFPITTTFLGEDLILSHIHEDQLGLVMLISISLIVDGLALIRIYSRIFLGPHIKPYHEVAKRSS
ncbi:MAG: proton-conducting transporter membrane subunit [Cyclobacteriaceae bacterium]